MAGAEYVTARVLEALWNDLAAAFQLEFAESKASDGLHLVRGRWVKLDRARLGRMLEEFRAVEHVAKEHGLDFVEAMRLLAGTSVSGGDALLDAAARDRKTEAGAIETRFLPAVSGEDRGSGNDSNQRRAQRRPRAGGHGLWDELLNANEQLRANDDGRLVVVNEAVGEGWEIRLTLGASLRSDVPGRHPRSSCSRRLSSIGAHKDELRHCDATRKQPCRGDVDGVERSERMLRDKRLGGDQHIGGHLDECPERAVVAEAFQNLWQLLRVERSLGAPASQRTP
jgi:hypothetical protein